MRLESKTIAVTGAQQGIGAAVARAAAREGADVVVNWLDDEDGARAVSDDVAAAGAGAVLVQGSVTDEDAIARIVDAGLGLGGRGRLDGFVNNAGIFPRVPFLDVTGADWDVVHDVNLKGTFRCTQAAARAMIAAGNGGSIVNLSSASAFRGSPNGVHYAASKAGVLGLTRAAALDLAPHRIPGQRHRARPDRYRAASLRDERGGDRRRRRRDSAGPHRDPGRGCRACDLPALGRVVADHGADAARQRRAVSAVTPIGGEIRHTLRTRA